VQEFLKRLSSRRFLLAAVALLAMLFAGVGGADEEMLKTIGGYVIAALGIFTGSETILDAVRARAEQAKAEAAKQKDNTD